MSTDYTTRQSSSDLDAFKNDGEIRAIGLVVSGVLAGGASATQSASTTLSNSPDYYQVFFENTVSHPGKFRRLDLEDGVTLIHETTTSTDLTGGVSLILSGSTVTVQLFMLNIYSTAVTLQTTTLNFRFMPYLATIG